MFHIRCPYCEELREEEEFHSAGEAHIARPVDPDACSDAEWAEYIYLRKNPKGLHHELWVHEAGCRKYFHIERDTVTYRILRTAKLGEMEAPQS